VVDILALLLPESSLYSVLCALPPPNPTNPLSTTTSAIQEAAYNSLPILEEIVSLIEKDEDGTVKKEIDQRRQRMGGPTGEELRKEVVREILGTSKAILLNNWVTLC
jgi:superkiller protein 3